ncbi:defensin Ec-AMP-D1-like [Cicer arietinum]|uniref:Defensin Ec-AMP-D1-like n=1 Tax=Cicer arietinum TaxID=3827 RepID=A0A1S2YTD3_CICAR|nr:defensin Ec-AMP-D1-like [Cicer arietinum]
MARLLSSVSTIFVMFLLLVVTEMGANMVAEARSCISKSFTYKGLCVHDRNCANVCRTEGFVEGHCRGFAFGSRCFCYKPC